MARYEVGFLRSGAVSKPNSLTVKIFDKTLKHAVEDFVKRFPAMDHFINKTTEDYDEYWLEYGRDVQMLYRLLNFYMWIVVRDLPDLKRLAEQAAKQIGNARVISLDDRGNGTYEIIFEVNGKKMPSFKIPYGIMDEVALRGHEKLEEDMRDLFVDLIVRHQMKNAT